jgi:hypothetical protein
LRSKGVLELRIIELPGVRVGFFMRKSWTRVLMYNTPDKGTSHALCYDILPICLPVDEKGEFLVFLSLKLGKKLF